MATLDTNPVFYRQWEQLGHAVVILACKDYASARKRNSEQAVLDVFEKFFRSKYFGRICPAYDGHELFEILVSGGWRKIPRMHHYTPQPTYVVWADAYIPKIRKDNKGRKRKYDY